MVPDDTDSVIIAGWACGEDCDHLASEYHYDKRVPYCDKYAAVIYGGARCEECINEFGDGFDDC